MLVATASLALPAICFEGMEALDGTVQEHIGKVRDIQFLVDYSSTDIPLEKRGAGLTRLQEVLRKRAAFIGFSDPIQKFQGEFRQAVAALKPDDLKGTSEEFQRAVNLVKTWDQNYPPSLVNQKVMGVFNALSDHTFTNAEIKALNKDMANAYRLEVEEERRRIDDVDDGPAPVRSRLRRAADDGQIVRPLDGNAAGSFKRQ